MLYLPGLLVDAMKQLQLFSDPGRDPRRHGATQLFVARPRRAGRGGVAGMRAGDDAGDVKLFTVQQALSMGLAFADQHQMLLYYQNASQSACML